MKLNVKLIDKIVGLFILVAILGMVAILVFLGLNQRWFTKNYHFTSHFKSAQNISPGMTITFRGFEIGKVEKLELDPDDRTVKMSFLIYSEYYPNLLFKNSVIELVSSPIGLGSGLVFHPGKDTKLMEPDGVEIPAYNTEAGMKLVAMGLVDREQTDDSIGALLAQVGPILQQIPPVLYSVSTLLADLDKSLKGSPATELGAIFVNVNKTLNDVQTALTSVDTILNGRDNSPLSITFNNLSRFSDSLGQIVAQVNSTLSMVTATVADAGKIVNQVNTTLVHETENIDKLMADLKGTTANIEKLTADPTGLVVRLINPQGSLKTLLDDNNQLFNTITTNLDDLLLKMQRMVSELEGFVKFVTGTAPQISGLLEEGKRAVTTAQDVLEGVSNNPLLKGGITEKREQPGTYNSYRDGEF